MRGGMPDEYAEETCGICRPGYIQLNERDVGWQRIILSDDIQGNEFLDLCLFLLLALFSLCRIGFFSCSSEKTS
jgi:hypothetical protein